MDATRSDIPKTLPSENQHVSSKEIQSDHVAKHLNLVRAFRVFRGSKKTDSLKAILPLEIRILERQLE